MRQVTEAARLATADRELQKLIHRRVCAALADTDLDVSTPVIIGELHRIVRGMTGIADPYAQAKDRLNRMALELVPRIEELVSSAADPLDAALRLAAAGNVIDMIVHPDIGGEDIASALNRALSAPFPERASATFAAAVDRASSILFLADNAGEIVFDKVLMARLPREKITYAVRGGPVINDVTIVEAASVGMTDLVEVIDNGADLPGTVMEYCSEAFRRRFRDADLIVSKGQGNYESLSEEDREIFFLFTAKCEVMTLHLGLEVGTLVAAPGEELRRAAAASR